MAIIKDTAQKTKSKKAVDKKTASPRTNPQAPVFFPVLSHEPRLTCGRKVT